VTRKDAQLSKLRDENEKEARYDEQRSPVAFRKQRGA